VIGFLTSYWYFRSTNITELLDEAGGPRPSLFADSGAFTAHETGTTLDVADYAAWLHKWKDDLTIYANLDVKGDYQASAKNQAILEADGLSPMPVFHAGSPWHELERLTTEYDYIAIGGLVGAPLKTRDRRLWGYLNNVHEVAAQNGCHLHGFGVTSWNLVRRFPWRSVDSSSATSSVRYGMVRVFDPYRHKWVAWHCDDRLGWHRNGWLVREYGMDPDDFNAPSRELRGPLIQLAGRAWARAAQSLGERTSTYVVDAAINQLERPVERTDLYVAETALACNERAVYVADPHPTPATQYRRIFLWNEANRWLREQPDTQGAGK